MREKPQNITNESNERNMETVILLLQDGSPQALARLHVWYPEISEEQMKLASYFAKMRKEVHDQGDREALLRKRENPKATEEELSIGIYLEYIEPQVRDAVRQMRKKGYSTYESGFYGSEGFQRIGLLEHQLNGAHLSQEIVDEAKRVGAEIRVILGRDDAEDRQTRDAIEIHFTRFVDLEIIKKLWDMIVRDLPDLGHSALPSTIMGAHMFREGQEKYK